MRVVGIDPGTISIDICGLDNGRVFLDRTLPTAEALASPSIIGDILAAAGPLDLVAGPSGYGLPLTRAQDLTDNDLRLAYLANEGESGGIGGLRRLMRSLARATVPVILTPGVVHLASVPAHRKINRVDMGTADKVCAAALAIHERAREQQRAPSDISLILLELGGAFTAALAIERGRIVDGLGGTSGPLGARAAGALDGEVAYLAGTISKALLFRGGVADVASAPEKEAMAWQAYVEGAVKAAAALKVSAPGAREVVLSGRYSRNPAVRDAITAMVNDTLGLPTVATSGFAATAGEAAQGAALLADGLAGGASAALVEAMGIRGAAGSALDYLYIVTPAAARARLGIA